MKFLFCDWIAFVCFPEGRAVMLASCDSCTFIYPLCILFLVSVPYSLLLCIIPFKYQELLSRHFLCGFLTIHISSDLRSPCRFLLQWWTTNIKFVSCLLKFLFPLLSYTFSYALYSNTQFESISILKILKKTMYNINSQFSPKLSESVSFSCFCMIPPL